ncbi:MAG: serine--tRNA ligase [SAR202 cluster bacterium]|nr:serine--tRNA ligase [SAR202 cluster bacterium]
MINIDLIRNEPERVRKALEKRSQSQDPVDRLLALDSRRREIIVEGDALRGRRNDVSKQISLMKVKPPELIEEMRGVGGKIKELEEEARRVEEELAAVALVIPNIPDDDVPVGPDESHNVVARTVGAPRKFDFKPLQHWELGEKLDIIDLERGAKLSGSRFYVLKGKGATLQRALINWMLNLHIVDHGYDELYLPYMVTTKTATGSGQLPKFAENMYHDAEDDLWMVPTAEVPITNLYGDEILPPGGLPKYYVAHTPCFRREKAAAGRDTRGIKRVHQFDKVEMFKFVEPAESAKELDKLVADAEDVAVRLGIPHRVLKLCTGDLSFASVKTYDVEMWSPGVDSWLEVSSCSNCTDFQARRANIRYRPDAEARPRLLHTLNGSGLGVARVVIAVMENYQQANGSIVVPEVLRPYTGWDRIG